MTTIYKGKMANGGKYICNCCMIQKRTKLAYEKHISLCNFIHTSAKDHADEIDFQEKMPSQEDMFKIMIRLCQENQNLKKRVDKLEKSNYLQKRKTIDEHLSGFTNNIVSYSDWMQSLIVSETHLNKLFSTDLNECLKIMIDDAIEKTTLNKIPLRAFTQKPNVLYVFDNTSETPKWRVMATDEFQKLIMILSQRVMRKYFEWKMEHQDEMDSSENAKELQIQYTNKATGGQVSIDKRTAEVKRWVFSKIQESLKTVDF